MNLFNFILLSIILISGVTLPTIGNLSLSILRAQNKMIYRTITVVISCVMNIFVTIIGIKHFGYWGAAVGTAFSSAINFLMMNFYYHKQLGFKIFKLFYDICFKTIICVSIPTILIFFVKRYFSITLFHFVCLAVLFMIIYFLLLFFISFNRYERKAFFHFFYRSR